MSVMYFYAVDEERNIITATLGYTKSGKKAFCPDENCGQPFFSKHYSKNNCDGWSHYPNHKPCNYMHGEMCDWHFNLQILAKDKYGYSKEGRKLFAGERIPDIYGFGRVIEVQHSSISLIEIINRSKFYRKQGYKIDWIFDFSVKQPDYVLEFVSKYKMGRVFIYIHDRYFELIKRNGVIEKNFVTLDYIFKPKREIHKKITLSGVLQDPQEDLELKKIELENKLKKEKQQIYLSKFVSESRTEIFKLLQKAKILKEKGIENFGSLEDGRIWTKY